MSQFEGWRGSRHSQSMGPGVLGQLLEMAPDALDEHQSCLRCHAPLAEQAQSLSAAISEASQPDTIFDGVPGMHGRGLTCAGCHVRGYRWYGPPRQDGRAGTGSAANPLPHHGWVSTAAFEDSRFCAACHQFEDGGFALNGKLLENTYREWQTSHYAREGISCQSCHMPGRRHLWRGIHDPEMVNRGVTVTVRGPLVEAGLVTGALAVKNTGTGHYFPTYVTPSVILEAYQEDTEGGAIEETLRSHAIGRRVLLDLSRELADTRLAPDEQATLDYRAPRNAGAVALVYRVRVEPDAFYVGFFSALLQNEPRPHARRLLERAAAEAEGSAFILFSNRKPLPAAEGSLMRE